jgi:hypothetical protein
MKADAAGRLVLPAGGSSPADYSEAAAGEE